MLSTIIGKGRIVVNLKSKSYKVSKNYLMGSGVTLEHIEKTNQKFKAIFRFLFYLERIVRIFSWEISQNISQPFNIKIQVLESVVILTTQTILQVLRLFGLHGKKPAFQLYNTGVPTRFNGGLTEKKRKVGLKKRLEAGVRNIAFVTYTGVKQKINNGLIRTVPVVGLASSKLYRLVAKSYFFHKFKYVIKDRERSEIIGAWYG